MPTFSQKLNNCYYCFATPWNNYWISTCRHGQKKSGKKFIVKIYKMQMLLIQIQKRINNINICCLPFVSRAFAMLPGHLQWHKVAGLPSSSTKWLSIIVTQPIAYWTISETKLKTHEFPIFFVPQMSTYVLWGRILPGSTFEKCFGGLFKPVVLCTQQKEACGYDWVRVYNTPTLNLSRKMLAHILLLAVNL